MQVSKTYGGSVAVAITEKRNISYGAPATMTIYPSKVDTINGIIAEFLHNECGVQEAVYESRSGSANFLWIYNVPFLFAISGKDAHAAFYGPLSGTALNAGTDGNPAATYDKGLSKFFNGETGTYSIGLVFAGNPNNGFALRFKTYNTNSISQYFVVKFMKCYNVINRLTSVVWCAQNIYSSGDATKTSELLGGMNGIDLSAGTIIEDSFSTALIDYDPRLHTKAIHKWYNMGALPLVPLQIGPYRANGIYHRPLGFYLPPAVSITTEVQAEITISGRSFLLTDSDSLSPNYINMGLIETT